VVDTQAADDGHEVSSRIANLLVRCALPADEGLLKHVFGVGDTPQHSVGHGEKKPAMLVECRQQRGIVHTAGNCFFGAEGNISTLHGLDSFSNAGGRFTARNDGH